MSLTKKTKDRSSADYWREAADATAAAATAADSTAVDAAAVMDALEPADAAAEAV
jgi:hypothetical protein